MLAPGLIPRFPLRDLHWRSDSGNLRSIPSLHVDLLPAGTDFTSPAAVSPISSNPSSPYLQRSGKTSGREDGFLTASLGGRFPDPGDSLGSTLGSNLRPPGATRERRHQIPGLRRTPYLKILLVRCDDSDAYKSARAQIREWIKEHTPPSGGKSLSTTENHDAFEWMIVHVVIPNTAAFFQPRVSGSKASEATTDVSRNSTASRWRPGSSTLLEKLRGDFNTTSKGQVEDRVAQIRIGINDLPYDLLPRVVPAVPTGYAENDQDAENAWADLIGKFKDLILSSFNMRVSQYEDDIREKDAQRTLPGWNFCTFFILKEGLARGFESVGLVEDALRGYDELSVGLDTVLVEHAASASAGGVLLSYTEDLKDLAKDALSRVERGNSQYEDEESVNLQSGARVVTEPEDIPVGVSKKPYRDLILANNVSVFDFRCYIFARQISLLLRLGNAWSTREELLAKLKEQQDLVLHGVAPRLPPPQPAGEEPENLLMLSEICKRALKFIPAIMFAMRQDIMAGLRAKNPATIGEHPSPPILDLTTSEVIDNIVASYAFSVAQQILAQTSTKALPIPPSALSPRDGNAHESKAALLEPKTMIRPARTSLQVRANVRVDEGSETVPDSAWTSGPSDNEQAGGSFLRPGLEELASRRAELYALSRNILEDGGRKRGWNNGWESVPMVGDTGIVDMEDIGLDDDAAKLVDSSRSEAKRPVLLAGIGNELLRTALDSEGDFYRLYEILTDKALRHYTVAGHNHSVQACMADLAILKHHLGEFEAAASYLHRATPFFGELGWSLLELSMLIVYIKCLKELKRKDQYVAAIRKLLSQAAAAVKDKIAAKSSVRLGGKKNSTYLDTSVLSGYLGEFLSASNDMEESVRMPLENFFDELAIDAAPAYDPGQDSFSIILKYRSLFPESFEADKASLRMRPAAGGNREIWLHTRGPLHIKPGMNTIQPHSNDFTAGIFEVDEIFFASHNAVFYLKRDAAQPIEGGSVGVFRNPKVALFQRANCLDVRLMASREVQLDKNNTVDVQVLVGWNMITHCVVKIKPGTGGLRLLTHEAKVLGPNEPSRKPDGGVFTFGRIPEDSTVTIRLPFTVEQDVLHVSVKVEVVYSTDRGNFGFYKSPSVPIALVLGVNVQDVFKHAALFSRFTISTVTSSPLRLYESELAGSEVFDSHSGLVPSQAVMIFPKQPVSVMYKTTRKSGVKITHKTAKTMYLRLWYSVLLDEIEAVFEDTLTRELAEKSLWEYSKLVVSHVIGKLHNSLTDYDLEKIMLLGELQTTFLGDVRWESEFRALGAPLTASQLAKFMRDWQSTHRRLSVVAPIHRASKSSTAGEGSKLVRSIVIPVDIPSITIVHTADIRLQKPVAAISMADPDSGASAVCVNQVLPARLHLKWTRAWDTGDFDPATAAAMAPASPAAALAAKGGPSVHLTEDIEFSYEVTAPTDTWLLGGRRKGHFVIPGVADPNGLQGLTSTVSTEAVIALLLIPLREGWLPYPTVEIREVRSGTASMGPGGADGKDGLIAAGGGEGGGGGGGAQHGHCETDYRNLGETVRVVADRGRITLSLDASGPGGGPLVLESERLGLAGRVVA